MSCSLCDAPAKARGWCWAHYLRWKRHGDPNGKGQRRRGAPIEHGTHAGYVAGCRCDDCMDGMRAYKADYARRIRSGDAQVVHGKASSYCSGCRCAACLDAMRAEARRKRHAGIQRLRGTHALAHLNGGTDVYWARCTCGRIATDPSRRAAARKLLTGHIRPANRVTRTDAEIEQRNYRFREEALASAVASADDELRALIEEQARDARKWSESPKGCLSLDAPTAIGEPFIELIGSPWDDPTFDAAVAEAG